LLNFAFLWQKILNERISLLQKIEDFRLKIDYLRNSSNLINKKDKFGLQQIIDTETFEKCT